MNPRKLTTVRLPPHTPHPDGAACSTQCAVTCCAVISPLSGAGGPAKYLVGDTLVGHYVYGKDCQLVCVRRDDSPTGYGYLPIKTNEPQPRVVLQRLHMPETLTPEQQPPTPWRAPTDLALTLMIRRGKPVPRRKYNAFWRGASTVEGATSYFDNLAEELARFYDRVPNSDRDQAAGVGAASLFGTLQFLLLFCPVADPCVESIGRVNIEMGNRGFAENDNRSNSVFFFFLI